MYLGHTLLSDLLRDNDVSGPRNDSKMAELFKKFPSLSRILSAYEQHQLVSFIQQKVSNSFHILDMITSFEYNV